jgi:hypothetical protein
MGLAEDQRAIKLLIVTGKEHELYMHPFFWAPSVVFGDGG